MCHNERVGIYVTNPYIAYPVSSSPPVIIDTPSRITVVTRWMLKMNLNMSRGRRRRGQWAGPRV